MTTPSQSTVTDKTSNQETLISSNNISANAKTHKLLLINGVNLNFEN